MKKSAFFLVLVWLAGMAAAQQAVVVRGSDSMVLLGQRWSQRLRQIFPSAVLLVYGGGSSGGASALASGRAQIAQLPRQLSPRERDAVEAATHHPVLEFPVGIESVLVYVNSSNPITELTIGQLRDIYAGRVTNWRQVGGHDAPIHLYSSESVVGGSVFFNEVVMGGEEFDSAMRGFATAKQTADAVEADPHGIGFGGPIPMRRSRYLRIQRANGGAPETTMENVRSGRYLLSRYLYWAEAEPLNDAQRKISNWVLSAEGQLVVESAGYYPLNANDRAKATGLIHQAK